MNKRLTSNDPGHLLDKSPVDKPNDEAAFRHYRTRDRMLASINALATGNTQTHLAI